MYQACRWGHQSCKQSLCSVIVIQISFNKSTKAIHLHSNNSVTLNSYCLFNLWEFAEKTKHLKKQHLFPDQSSPSDYFHPAAQGTWYSPWNLTSRWTVLGWWDRWPTVADWWSYRYLFFGEMVNKQQNIVGDTSPNRTVTPPNHVAHLRLNLFGVSCWTKLASKNQKNQQQTPKTSGYVRKSLRSFFSFNQISFRFVDLFGKYRKKEQTTLYLKQPPRDIHLKDLVFVLRSWTTSPSGWHREKLWRFQVNGRHPWIFTFLGPWRDQWKGWWWSCYVWRRLQVVVACNIQGSFFWKSIHKATRGV